MESNLSLCVQDCKFRTSWCPNVCTVAPGVLPVSLFSGITSGLQLGRAEALRDLRNFPNIDRPELHSIDHLKERGVEKGSGRHFHPPRSRTICVQQDRYWHRFKGNLGETAERRGGARMGLSERNDAILSLNCN